MLEAVYGKDTVEHLCYQYNFEDFIVVASQTQCLIGLLGYHFQTQDDQVLELIMRFGFEESILQIYMHPMYDYYCYLCASEQVNYRSRSGNWDKYFAIKALKKFLETKFNVSADVLQILFRHITRLDINQF